MAEYFKEALRGEGLVYAANSSDCPAMKAADGSFLTPLIYSSEYIPFLLDRCRALEIDLLVPLFDIDLPVLAAHRAAFSEVGTVLAVSDQETLAVCNDKYRMFLKLKESGLLSPETMLADPEALPEAENRKLSWPLLVKPRFGMGSLAIHKACSGAELEVLGSICRREIAETYLRYEADSCPGESVIIQEMQPGNEYGLDVICDLDGRYVHTIVRRKLGMRSGETDEAIILGEQDAEYEVLQRTGEQLASVLRPKGLIDVDIMLDPEALRPYIIDINARFGGGYPFSHLAGADVPGAYIHWMKGEMAEGDQCCRGAIPGVHGYKEILPRRI